MKIILARFHPEAWINDEAVEVDPEGPTTWDVTEHICAMPREVALALRDNRENTDALCELPNVPEWIRNWNGPYRVEVQESIAEYFLGESS